MTESQYYVPGKIIFAFRHDIRFQAGQLLELLQSIEQLQNLGVVFPDAPGAVKSFRSRSTILLAEPTAFSFVTATLADAGSLQTTLATLKDLTQQGRPTAIIRTEDGKVVFLPPDQELPAAAVAVASLEAFSPDFLVGGATHQIVTGGPGGAPEEVMAPVGAITDFDFPQSPSLQPADGHPNRGAGVMVILLDTAPSVNLMADIPVYWTGQPLAQQLLPSLTPVPGQLTVYPASAAEMLPLAHNTLEGQRYLMPDHGMFVAGIVKTIAPDAELHLIETLSQYGVGSFTTIISALARAVLIPRTPGSHVVINCSASLGAWSATHPMAGVDPAFQDEMTYRGYVYLLELACAAATGLDEITIVASAGNSSAGKVIKDLPANPAAFSSVVSVGAMQRNAIAVGGSFPSASYSNRSDNDPVPALTAGLFVLKAAEPPKPGIMVFGGEPAPGDGVLGIFLGNVPIPATGPFNDPDNQLYKPNPSGWARWAGTSFAAPIVSGICARLAGELAAGGVAAKSSVVKNALFALQTGNVTANEFVIEVTQP